MLKRLIIAIVIICIFTVLATQTPLENLLFQYKGQPIDPYEEVDVLNQIQVMSAEEAGKGSENGEDLHKGISLPTHLEIPTLDVSASIYGVGLTSEGAMDTLNGPTPIAWYKYGSIPGQEGNTLLAGHRDWNGAIGTLFYLETMRIGDTLVITFENGKKQTFILESNNIYDIDKIPENVMSLKGESRVTVITCAGDYNKNTGLYKSRAVAIFKKMN
ncbi:class F sortase [Viridibacillus arvi]|uniref:class F sortase n=1 Tax=Viridibacillus arvi TaxID=263475 RepID=UPI0034D01888